MKKDIHMTMKADKAWKSLVESMAKRAGMTRSAFVRGLVNKYGYIYMMDMRGEK